MKAFVKKTYKDAAAVVVMLVVMALLLYRLMDMDMADIHVPFSYNGGDGMSYLVNAVMLDEGWTTMETDRLGAPFGYAGYDFYASSLHQVDNMILKLIVSVFHDPAVSVNLLYLSLFPLIGLFAYFVLRQLKLRPWISAAGGLTYAFLPYVFLRGLEHFVLASYYFVPVSVLLCVWIFTDDTFFCFHKGFFKNWKNYFAIVMTILIANNGIAYYPFFTCFFLIIVGVVKWIRSKRFANMGKALVLIGTTVAGVGVALLPNLMYVLEHGKSKEAIFRTIDGAETYALKIAQLFMPTTGHGFHPLDSLIAEYNAQMPLVNENYMSYLGIMGCIGFLVLLVYLFVRSNPEGTAYKQQLEALSLMNIAAVLLGTVGGFSSLFSILVTSMIRCYNRISVFIAFIAIAAACIILNVLAEKIYTAKLWEKAHKSVRYIAYTVFTAVCLLLTLGGVYQQYPGTQFDYVTCKEMYTSDAAFISQIEAMVPEGSMIYQMPYHEYPEGGPVESMNDYDLWAGYVHSETLKWSYGGVKGREGDKWFSSIDNNNVQEVVRVAKETGYAGIYVERRAFTEEELEERESELRRVLGSEPIESPNGYQSFYRF